MAVIKKKKTRKPKITFVCILTGHEVTVLYSRAQQLAKKYKFSSIEEYQQYYIHKDGIILLREGYTEKQIRDKHNCNNKTSIPFNILKRYVKKFKNRQKIEKLEKRKAVQNFLKTKECSQVREYTRQPVDFTDKKQVEKITESACLRPDIYLNNERACNGCSIFEYCACPIKKWNNKLSEPKKRRR
jgi:hypothetical protein